MTVARRFAIAAVAALYALVLVALWPTIADINDYVGFFAGARALLAGANPYDPAYWPQAWAALGQRPDTVVFGYPPWVAVAFAPLALLPLAVGSLVWTLGGLAAALLGTRAVTRRLGVTDPVPFLLLAALSWPALLVFLQGQWGYLLFTLACACLVDLLGGRDLRAGAWWGVAMLAKPQLFVLGSLTLAAWAIARRRVRVVLGAAAVVAVGFSVGTLVVPGWFEAYFRLTLLRATRSTQQPTLAGLASDLAGERWPLAWLLAVLLLGALVALTTRRAPKELRGAVAFAGTLALSVAAAPYSWSYDQYLVLLAGGIALALAEGLPSRARLAIGSATFVLFGPLAFALWESAYVRWHDTLSGLVPLLALVLLGVAAHLAGAQRPEGPGLAPSGLRVGARVRPESRRGEAGRA